MPDSSLPIAEVPDDLSEITGRVEFGGERIAMRKQGKTVAVLVPSSDLEALEALEGRLDLLDALDALADYRVNGGISFDGLKDDLGL